MKDIKLPGAELRLADVVSLEGINGFHTATVKAIRGRKITFFRPYVATADFSCGDSVICYVGIEEWTVTPRAGDDLFTVLERKDLK